MTKFLIIAALVVAVVAGSLALRAGDGSTDAAQPASNPGDSNILTPSPTPTPDFAIGTDTTPGPQEPEGQSVYESGPHLVASDALADLNASSNQQRLFRTEDGTIAVLYHRPGGPRQELHEIVLIHSHDEGETWHGEVIIAREAPTATYTGVMDVEGNLYVAYGRDADGASGGAVHVLRLSYDEQDHAWQPQAPQRVVWDWPGRGASSPVLALTGRRLWLAYRYFEASRYSFLVRYTDLDAQGSQSQGGWSGPFAIVQPNDRAIPSIGLVSHGDNLSAFFTDARSRLYWRLLHSPEVNPGGWLSAELLLELPVDGGNVRFAAVPGQDSGVHLAISSEGAFVGYLRFDGISWSNFRQLGVSNVYGPAVAPDSRGLWAFWVRQGFDGRSRVDARQWTESEGWSIGDLRLTGEHYGQVYPSLLAYRRRSGTFLDISRQAVSLVKPDPQLALKVSDFLTVPGDILYVGREDVFNFVPVSYLITSANQPQPEPFQYWNGSGWIELSIAPWRLVSSGSAGDEYGPLVFTPPQDWQPTEVNGITAYFIRLERASFSSEALSAYRLNPTPQVTAPHATATLSESAGIAWTERYPGSVTGKLWYSGLSRTPARADSEQGHHTHGVTAPQDTSPSAAAPAPLPPGSPRQYTSVELEKGPVFEYQLLDGQVRYVKVVSTKIQHKSATGVTVWTTAAVEVSGPGLEPQVAEIPAAYFQPPVVLNDVRVHVEITREFNDLRLEDGGGTTRAARLMLSDARYSLTDVSAYRWPFPGMLWGIGPEQTYYQGLRGTPQDHTHAGSLVMSMPAKTPIYAWHSGILQAYPRRDGWQMNIAGPQDGKEEAWHHVSPVGVEGLPLIGEPLALGQEVGMVPGNSDVPSVRWGAGAHFDWAPVLAEWYMAHSTPAERSYVKDWLVLGPFSVADAGPARGSTSSLLSVEFLPDEAGVMPEAGMEGPGGRVWKRYDAIVPGVIDVAEAVSEFPHSGWAKVNGNYPNSVAYLATYVYSPAFDEVVLNIGSSDFVKVWVNGEVVLEREAFVKIKQPGDWSIWPDFYKVPVQLQDGWNVVLVKLKQGRTDFSGLETPQNAWQFSFRISNEQGEPLSHLAVSPERQRGQAAVSYYAFAETDRARLPSARPPFGRHDWPEKVDLRVGESYTYTLMDGSQRTLKLIDYKIIIPRHKVEATIEVSGDGRTQRHTLEVALAGVPVSINGLRVYAYAWKEANDFGFEKVGITGDFPLTQGKDVGFALSDPRVTMFPDMDAYTYPMDLAFNQGYDVQTWLEPAGELEYGAATYWAHAGYDIRAPHSTTLRAWHDGTVYFSEPSTDPQALGEGLVTLATTTGDRHTDPYTWIMTHVMVTNPKVPSGTFVKKGTPLAVGGSHFGSKNSFDFGGWLFLAEVWNHEHRDDYPTPRHWLVLGPYQGGMEASHIAGSESGDLPSSIEPRKGETDRSGGKEWQFKDNFVNSIVMMNELLSESPWAGYSDRKPLNSVGYAATYIYSPEDHTTDNKVWLKWGVTYGGKVWLNGKTIFDNTGNLASSRYHTLSDDEEQLPIVIDEFDIPVPLKKGWNTLIIKTNSGSNGPLWRFSAKIGDREGRRIPGIEFSTRDINLRLTSVDRDRIGIAWSHPDFHGTHVETYKLDVATDPGFANLVISDLNMGKVTEYVITGLDEGQEYFVRVKPYNYSEMGGSVYWQHVDMASAVTSGTVSPRNLTALPGDGEVLLRWRGFDAISSYTVRRATSLAGPFSVVARNVRGTEYQDRGLDNSVTYYYQVTGVSGGGETPASNTASATPKQELAANVQHADIRVRADRTVAPFSTMVRGVATNNWNWLWNGLMGPTNKREAIIDATSYLSPGVVRIGGGLWSNRTGWDRSGVAPEDGEWTYTDSANGKTYTYRHAYSRQMIDSFADFIARLGAEAIVQVNICDDNPAMWADLVRYANVEKGYGFKYWELGNELSLEPCNLDENSYAERFVSYTAALKAVDPSIKVMGPSAHNPANTAWEDALVEEMGNGLDVLSWHWYPLTEWVEDPAGYSYEHGSIDALLAFDGAVGSVCHHGYGCSLDDRIDLDDLGKLGNRRAIAGAKMADIQARYGRSHPGIETAMTEFGVHASHHEHPINGNHVAAVWLADMLPRWAYSGLDIATYYSLEDGGTGDGDENTARGLMGIWDGDVLDIRPTYYTMFLLAQHFGDVLVESSTSDPYQKVVGWASKDSGESGSLKLLLVNLSGRTSAPTISIEGFNPVVAHAYELTSSSPLSLEDPASYTRHTTTINGQKLPDYDSKSPAAFRSAIAAIRPKVMDVSGSFKYVMQPYSVVAIELKSSR